MSGQAARLMSRLDMRTPSTHKGERMTNTSGQPLEVSYIEPWPQTGATFHFCPGFKVSDAGQQVGMVVIRLPHTTEKLLRDRLDDLLPSTVNDELPRALMDYGQQRVEHLVGSRSFVADLGDLSTRREIYNEFIRSSADDAIATLADLIRKAAT
jgi:hypothetical protein